MNQFEYVMYGKVYRIEGEETTEGSRLSAYVSFGGLLMRLKGEVLAFYLSNFMDPNMDNQSELNAFHFF